MTDYLPFAGLRVVDLAQGLAGPYCSMMLAQYGADVVKVEPPEGDWSRATAPYRGDKSASFFACNRGKRSLVADLKQEAARKVVLDLAAQADVVIENNRAGISERLGVGYPQVRARNPDVIYVSVTGFGQVGSGRGRAATDTLIQSGSGFMTNNIDRDGMPLRIDYPVPDYVTGMTALQSVATALFARTRGLGGRHLDINLMNAMLAFQQHGILADQLREGEPRRGPFPPTGVFRTADGQIGISVLREKYFRGLCNALDVAHLIDDPRFVSVPMRVQHEPELEALLAPAFLARSTQEVEEALTAADVPHQRVLTYPEAISDAHVREVGMIRQMDDLRFGSIPVINPPGAHQLSDNDPRASAPSLGEHSLQVLQELGYSQADVDGLLAEGAIVSA